MPKKTEKVSKTELARQILDDRRTNYDLKLKLQYCQDGIDAGRRDFIVTRRDELIREAIRTYPWLNP